MNPATCARHIGCLWVLVWLGLPATASAGEGACCFPDDLCLDGIDGADCEAIDGTYLGDDTTCDGDEDGDGVVGCADLCPDTPPGVPVDEDGCPTTGACCFVDEDVCLDELDFETCSAIGGAYKGNGSSCDVPGTCPPLCEGDVNGDGLVDPLDMGFIVARFGCSYPEGGQTCLDADVNGDGLVDPLDSGFVAARFGTCTSGSLSASVVVVNLPSEGHFHPGMIVGLDLDIQGGIGDPETEDFTYDWNLDVTGALGSSLDDSDFMDEDTKVTSFVPDVEGEFVINCDVTDGAGTTVTTDNLTITVIALTAEPVVMNNGGCIVGPPSDFVPPGADGPGTIQEEYTFATLEADVMGQLGEVDYLWSATANEEDFGSFDDPMVPTPVWNIPLVTEDTEVIFTVIVTDDRGPVEFDSVPWTVSPPVELSEIQYLGPAQATVDFPVTFIREEDSGTTPRIFRFRELPDGVTVGGDCAEGGGVTDFDQPVLACTMNFPFAGDYLLTVELRDGCADQTEGNPKPLIAYDFTVNVVP